MKLAACPQANLKFTMVIEFTEKSLQSFDKIVGWRGCRRNVGGVRYNLAENFSNPELSAFGKRDLRQSELEMTSETIVDIASISKQHTSALLMKLWDDELSGNALNASIKNFPQGIDTPINHFMDSLKARFTECQKFFAKVEEETSYQNQQITLRDLLNHTHGLGKVDDELLTAELNAELRKIDPNAQDITLDQHMASSKDPMRLDNVINATKKNSELDQHGMYRYSNFGTDFTAMIIETVLNKEFDQALKDELLTPCGLNNTHPQSEVKTLHQSDYDIARGCVIVGVKVPGRDHLNALEILDYPSKLKLDSTELPLDCRVVTVASSNFKTTMSDLANFACLYMGGEMFVNQEVKNAISDRSRAAKSENIASCHLGIHGEEGYPYVGHTGYNGMFESTLLYNPSNGAINANGSVLENVTNAYSMYVFRQSFSRDECQQLKSFLETLQKQIKPTWNSKPEERLQTLEEEAKRNPIGAALFQHLLEIEKDVMSYPITSLMTPDASEKEVPKMVARCKERVFESVEMENKWVNKISNNNSSESNIYSR